MLGSLPGNLNPAWMAATRDLDIAERLEGMLINAVVTMPYDRSVNIAGNNQHQRIGRPSKCILDTNMIKKAERDIQRLSEAAMGVVADFSGVDDHSDPELAQGTCPGQARVVVGKQSI